MKPLFQMPFMCHQKWRASTYDGHAPDQDSIDLIIVTGTTAGQPVFASAGGTVKEAFDTDSANPPYGSVVTIDHGGGWMTQYVHLNDQLSVSKGQTVVRGQKIGHVGNIAGIEPHLHYVQIENGQGVRITFNGVPIDVHAGARRFDGTYPTQELVSHNCPTGITANATTGGATATCAEGAGLRATVTCENTYTNKETTRRGPWVGARATSSVKCAPGSVMTDHGHEVS